MNCIISIFSFGKVYKQPFWEPNPTYRSSKKTDEQDEQIIEQPKSTNSFSEATIKKFLSIKLKNQAVFLVLFYNNKNTKLWTKIQNLYVWHFLMATTNFFHSKFCSENTPKFPKKLLACKVWFFFVHNVVLDTQKLDFSVSLNTCSQKHSKCFFLYGVFVKAMIKTWLHTNSDFANDHLWNFWPKFKSLILLL